MTPRQTEFFRALLAPFPPQAYYNVRGFTYIKAQTIENRLDDVVSPLGWTAEYTETKGGFKCCLKILCPDGTDEGWKWHAKEDGGGEEDMAKKQGSQMVKDEDNSEKSAYTNSFKRAASKWGFGRDLYQQGMPQYVADLYAKPIRSSIEPRIEDGYQRASDAEVQTRQPTNGQRVVNINPPTEAKQVFPWIKNIEKHFARSFLDQVNKFCTETFGFWDTRKLNDQQVVNLSSWVIGEVKQWPNYDGCFGVQNQATSSPMTAVLEAILDDGTITPRHRVKRAILACAKAVIHKQTGRTLDEKNPRDLNDMMAFVGEIGAAVPNHLGITGEVLMSLRDCDDDKWLSNILANAKRQMIQAATHQTAEVDRDPETTPF